MAQAERGGERRKAFIAPRDSASHMLHALAEHKELLKVTATPNIAK